MVNWKFVKVEVSNYKRYKNCYFLTDDLGNKWVFELVPSSISIRKYLAFLKVPKSYKHKLGVNTYVPEFREIEKMALKAIEDYEILNQVSDETKQTFGDLLDIL